jgi:outer membrane protein assembly factor BamB
VKARVPRTTYYVVFGIALILAVAALSTVAPSRALAASAAFASGGVVAVGEGNKVVVLSAATGKSLFTYTGVRPFWGPPSIVGSTLYEGDMAGNLYALATN